MRRSSRVWAAVVALCVALAVIGPAGAQPPSGGDPRERVGALSTRLTRLIKPNMIAANPAIQASELSLPADGPGSLLRVGDAVRVYVRVTETSQALEQLLRDAGAVIDHVAPAYRTYTALVAPQDLAAIGALAGVEHVHEALAPLTASDGTGPDGCATGVESEADDQLRAHLARNQFGVDGSGVEVGVLSDSYDVNSADATNAAQDIASADLPGTHNPCDRTLPVDVVAEGPSGASDEGRAMLQHVHDLAPGAGLSFATAVTGLYTFADNIRRLRTAGADVIVDDVVYFAEPFYQPGPIDVAIDEVTAAGATYFTAAGNSNVKDDAGQNVGSYETPFFRPIPCPPEVGLPPGDCHDFDPRATTDNDYDVTVKANGSLDLNLQWAESWNAVTSDFDIYVVDSAGAVLAASTEDNLVSQLPFEYTTFTNGSSDTSVRIVIHQFTVGITNPRFKVNMGRSDLATVEYPTGLDNDVVGPTIFGHNGAKNAVSLAATRYDDGVTAEWFSSHGPVTHYYTETDGTIPGVPLTQPDVLAKPDVTATDGACTTFFGPFFLGCHRFFGTSAAAPHAAAVAALLLQAQPALGPAQVASRLEATAAPMYGGQNVVGAGLVDAFAALNAGAPSPPRNVTAQRGDRRALLSWTPPADPGSSPVTGYRIRIFSDGKQVGEPITTGDVTSKTITGLTNGTTYTVTVAAINGQGLGLESAPSDPVTPVPDPPTGITTSDTNDGLLVDFDHTTFNQFRFSQSGEVSFRVRAYDGDGAVADQVTVDAPPALLTDVRSGQTYDIGVAAMSGGEASEELRTTTTFDRPAPLGLTRFAGGASARGEAITICQTLHPDYTTATRVLLARDDAFADALAGAPLAGDDACVLFTPGGPDAPLDDTVRAEVDRVLGGQGLVTVLGGDQAVSAQAVDELRGAGYEVDRVAGQTRFETAAMIARRVAERTGADQAMVAFGGAFPDALVGGAYGAETGIPIVLTGTDELHPSAAQAISDLGLTQVTALGGTAVISDAVVAALPNPRRVAGPNRMATAVAIAEELWAGRAAPDTAVLLNAEVDDVWILALAGAPLSAALDAPQLGLRQDGYPTETETYLRQRADHVTRGVILGGQAFVSSDVAAVVAADIG